MSVELRPCGLQGWAVCDGNCGNCGTTATTTTDGYWYHGNGKIGGEFHPTKPNAEERYGEHVKVKHGRWKAAGMGDYMCSLCAEVVSGNRYHYCPNCGARMDLIGEDKSHPFAESVMMGMDGGENGR